MNIIACEYDITASDYDIPLHMCPCIFVFVTQSKNMDVKRIAEICA